MQFERGKIAFQLFFIILFQWATTTCQLNLYDTDRTFENNSLQYDCLDYHIYREQLAYQELSDILDEVIPYCFRPADPLDESLEALVDSLSQKLSFEQLREANIPSLQLLSWSVSMTTTERYQFYMNAPDASLNEYFYNSTEPRFGSQCQYSFMFDERMTFNQIIEATFRGRLSYPESSDMMVETPCYVLLECRRDELLWCLDCFDEDLDEKFCFDMEINECSEDEYRLDGAIEFSYINSCFQDPTFRCDEHSCRANSNLFPCVDGQCIPEFEECHNGRHVLLTDTMTAKGNLTDNSWIAMLYLIGFVKKVNERTCRIWIMNNTTYAAVAKCDSIFHLPIIPVYFCSDQQLCDSSTKQVKDLSTRNITTNAHQRINSDSSINKQQLAIESTLSTIKANLTYSSEIKDNDRPTTIDNATKISYKNEFSSIIDTSPQKILPAIIVSPFDELSSNILQTNQISTTVQETMQKNIILIPIYQLKKAKNKTVKYFSFFRTSVNDEIFCFYFVLIFSNTEPIEIVESRRISMLFVIVIIPHII